MKSKFIRIVIGALIATFVATIWLTLAMLLAIESRPELRMPISAMTLIVPAAINFATIGLVLVIVGVPAYLTSLYLRVRSKLPGIIFGFILGMLGSIGYGVDMHPKNLLFGAGVFGIAGILAAIVFLYFAQREEVPNIPKPFGFQN